ncbi:hypothetical protein [Candidatus Tisiphia endosymbiont of Nemotelus uliginosus]|uniref:hypothetical protein n=1 Tax=Candidatus Tisiphia endosymbiont of Nemotelus uliginosus TaxID=3077926 RepID=UPI0035C8BE9A
MYITLGVKSKNINILKLLAKFSLNKSILIILIAMFLFINRADSALPPLPSDLPEAENSKPTNKQSWFEKIFKTNKSDSPTVQARKQETAEPSPDNNIESVEPIIDLGDKKLPILEGGSTPEERKAIRQVSEPLYNTNSIDYIKKDQQNIDNLVPSLPVGSKHNVAPSLSSPLPPDALPVLPSVLNNAPDNPQQVEGVEGASPTAQSATKDNMPITKVPEQQKVQENTNLPKADKEILPQLDNNPTQQQQAPKLVIPSTSQPATKDNMPVTKVPKQQKSQESVNPKAETLSSSPPAAIAPGLIMPESVPGKVPGNIDVKAGEVNSTPTTPLQLKDTIISKPEEHTPIPVFVKEKQQIDEGDQDIQKKKSTEAGREESNKQESAHKPTLLDSTASHVNKGVDNTNSEENTKELALFITKERQMLLDVEDDDVVLGVLTEEARIGEPMDIRTFITIFRPIYERQKREVQRKKIDNFINHYSLYFRFNKRPINNSILLDNAFEAIRTNNLIALKAILDYYPILQKQGMDDDTLLHAAAELGNYYIAKFLIIRGINMNILDKECRTALEVTNKYENIACIIRQAMGSQ